MKRLRELFRRPRKPDAVTDIWTLIKRVRVLTPNDIRNMTFTTHRLREGYDMDEVDAYLDRVRHTIARLDKTIETLQKETKK